MHFSYLMPALEPWVVAPGGRCYTKEQAEECLKSQVQCPVCQKSCASQDAYESNFWVRNA